MVFSGMTLHRDPHSRHGHLGFIQKKEIGHTNMTFSVLLLREMTCCLLLFSKRGEELVNRTARQPLLVYIEGELMHSLWSKCTILNYENVILQLIYYRKIHLLRDRSSFTYKYI